jgi:serine/threonine protein kinase
MDLMEGGDLRYHHSLIRKFDHRATKFMIACVIMALEAVHSVGVIHRDLKPENLVFDSSGYLRLTDFGIAREWTPENASENSGTPGYMAPEVLCKQNHGIAADYFAVGIITYELVFGHRPYKGKGRKEVRDAILEKAIVVRPKDLPANYPEECADFITRCLTRLPHKRLGINGIEEVKNHAWFNDFDWEALKKKETEPFYKPNIDL